nr:transcription factor SPATULA [Ipomoea batatas]GMD90383.1 transcription factor SPATULA [Ipomoea batatas]GME07650.1 transcription factor SPATULA [Ipomoea batatas]
MANAYATAHSSSFSSKPDDIFAFVNQIQLCSSSHPQVFQPYAAMANSSAVGFLPSLGIYRSMLRRMCVHPLLGLLRITNLQISMIVKVRRELKLWWKKH